MNPVRTVGARLSLALLGVVALVLGLVYVIVVPSLKNRLVDARLNDLAHARNALVAEYELQPNDPDFFSNAAASTNARVVLLTVVSQSPTLVTPTQWSLPGRSAKAYTDDPVASLSARTSQLERGTVSRNDGEFAEVAIPLPRRSEVLLLAAPLHDALADVSAVQRRMLLAGGLAFVVALLVGYGAARLFARRIRRLERAADRIAGGRFDQQIADRSADELGELARAFDRMRTRLAGLDHARREFVANASHELRTPLFSLGGFLELLEDEDLDEPTRREFLDTMAEQVRRLTKLADDLLDLSKLDAGRLHVETQPVELESLAASAVDEFAGVARALDHPLEYASNGSVVSRGDPQRVFQIVRILLENALVHTPPGTPVEVSVRGTDMFAEITVRDGGPGVGAEDRSALFERFYRGESTKASGSGLGLAIAKELAELMGGRIELDSQPGRTTFALVLPAGQQAREAEPEPEPVVV
ncbi:MAG TPA: HAMP domain-containing sensor histidine kinase [Gaiellaceae bacterium]|nr:HAMP domain-containing sensor histidine kinase [Gaiellaceae bacterium]